MLNTAAKNKPLPRDLELLLRTHLEQDDVLLAIAVGDLHLDGRYGISSMSISRTHLYCTDPSHPDGILKLAFQDISTLYVKRMYGNALLIAEFGNTTKPLCRFTYSIADLADAFAAFILHCKEGENPDEEFSVILGTYEKMASHCPKCGRALSSHNSECLHCANKKKILSKLAHYIKPHLKLLFICFFLSLVTTVTALFPPTATKSLVDEVLPNGDKQQLMLIVFMLLLAYILQFSIGGLRGYLMRITGDRVVYDLRNDVYTKAQYLPMSFYDKTSTGSVISRVSGDTATLQGFMLRISQEAIIQFFTMCGIIVIMFFMNWKLTLLSLTPIPLVVIGGKCFGKKISPFYRRIWKRWSAVTSILTDTIPGIRVIKSFTSEKRAIGNFIRGNTSWLREDAKAAKIANIFPSVVTFLVTCGSLLIWGVGGTWVIDNPNGITPGLLISFISYASMFYAPVNFFANLNDSYQNALASAERILDIIDAEPEADFGAGNKLPSVRGKIEFRNVNFSFDRTKKVLDQINLVIEPGDIVGIVGTTGSGKSTLINLFMRFYDDYEGEILVDGVNIKSLDLEYFRSCIGYVQQEAMMFRDSIFNNIAYSKPNALVEEVIHAADVANAHNFIIKLPDAYDTMLGERGTGLSGGERQRLSIARAVLKNPSILIFDEATAAVDSETEHLIQEAIERLISGRTTLMIAHRLSTLRKANKIIVIDKGKIAECGSHDELMALKGKYHNLITIQSLSDKIRAESQS